MYMKKLLLIAAFGLMASPALAQNNATVSSTGDDNDATVNQTYTASSGYGINNATITQQGDEDTASATQSGAGNESKIVQKNWGTPGHIAQVSQTGDGNWSDVLQEQRGAEAGIDQNGTENQVNLKQAGPNDAGDGVAMSAGITQDGDYNKVGGYSDYDGVAYQKNGTSFPNDLNTLDVYQAGSYNKAGVWQEHHAEADIDQDGNWNEARVYQQAAPAGGDLGYAKVDQSGDYNDADVNQVGEGHYVDLGQDGDSNIADIDQYGGNGNRAMFSQSDDAEAYVNQNGNDNAIVGVGSDISGGTYAQGNSLNGSYLDVDQLGDGNVLFLDQNNGGTATVMQDGLTNTATVVQN